MDRGGEKRKEIVATGEQGENLVLYSQDAGPEGAIFYIFFTLFAFFSSRLAHSPEIKAADILRLAGC